MIWFFLSTFSKILGCELRYNQRPNSTEDYDLKYENIDMLECAKECLNDKSCLFKGWIFNVAREVKKNLDFMIQNIEY